MLTRRLLCEKVFPNLRYGCARASSTLGYAQPGIYASNVDRFPPHSTKRKEKHPIVKNFFLGKFDTDILAYPEIDSSDRYKAFDEWLKPIEDFITSIEQTPNKLTRAELLNELGKLGVFRGSIPEEYGGFDFSVTERTKLIETLSSLPWAGTYIVKNNIIPVYLITKYGSQDQKDKYLPRIATGEIIPSVCLTEVGNGTNIHNMKCSAVSKSENHWILNGAKHFVSNATESNLFIVFAKCIYDNDVSEKYGKLTALLIEKEAKNVQCSDTEDMIGQSSFPLSTVNFNNVAVTSESIIGQIGSGPDMLRDLLPPGRQCMAAYSVKLLKNFLNLLIHHTLHNKQFDKNMYEIPFVKEIITKITGVVYSVESVLYLTAGIEDQYENQDVEVEKAITETYCAKQCVTKIYEGLQLLSTYGILRKLPYAQLYDSALFLPIVETNVTEGNIYIGLLGLQHTGKEIQNDIKVQRNLLMYPKALLKNAFKTHRKSKEQLDLYIPDNLHHTFLDSGKFLEEMVSLLKSNTSYCLEEYGTEICNEHNVLKCLSKMATITYVTTAVLARASRAYCIGFRNADVDRMLADAVTFENKYIMEKYAHRIASRDLITTSYSTRLLADHIYANKKYFAVDALKKI